MAVSRDKQKLDELISILDYSSTRQWLNDNMCHSKIVGICITKGCDFITEVEADQAKGYCEVCQRTTVKSGLVLAGY